MHRVHRKEVPLKPYFPFPTGKTPFPIIRFRYDRKNAKGKKAICYRKNCAVSFRISAENHLEYLNIYIYVCIYWFMFTSMQKYLVILKYCTVLWIFYWFRFLNISGDVIILKRVSLLSFLTSWNDRISQWTDKKDCDAKVKRWIGNMPE